MQVFHFAKAMWNVVSLFICHVSLIFLITQITRISEKKNTNQFYKMIRVFAFTSASIFAISLSLSGERIGEGLLLHRHPYPFTMACKLRCIHTLYGGDAIAEISGMGNKHGIFKNITAPCQPAKKEIGAGIFGAFVIS